MDHVDASWEKKRDRDLMEVTFPKANDHGLSWMCSLRQNEADLQNDGIRDLKQAAKDRVQDRDD